MPEIASFIFFDIETTGFPWQERNQTKITEFSFVAALRKDLEVVPFGHTPLVSKLTFVLNPERRICPEVVKLTGLTNEILRHAPLFRQKINSVVTFIEELPKPVCLIAHNGNIFDFKVLLAECNDAGASLPYDLLCVDSLHGFRQILKGTNLCYKDLEVAVEPVSSSSSDDLLTDDEDDEWPDLNVSTEEWGEIDEICLNLSDISCEDFSDTEIKSQENIKPSVGKKRSDIIKKVFSKKAQNTEKECFTLSALYKRLLNKEENNAHRAEVDCIMLLQCVAAIKDKFLPWADNNCKPLTHIKPLVRY